MCEEVQPLVLPVCPSQASCLSCTAVHRTVRSENVEIRSARALEWFHEYVDLMVDM